MARTANLRVMLLFDTHVISTMMSTRAAPEIAGWLLQQNAGQLFTAAVCQAEILVGIAIMPAGHRRAALELAARTMFTDVFADRILPFDSSAAEAYAGIVATLRRSGRLPPPPDMMIAATALARGASVVTRNVRDFAGCGVMIVNPWDV